MNTHITKCLAFKKRVNWNRPFSTGVAYTLPAKAGAELPAVCKQRRQCASTVGATSYRCDKLPVRQATGSAQATPAVCKQRRQCASNAGSVQATPALFTHSQHQRLRGGGRNHELKQSKLNTIGLHRKPGLLRRIDLRRKSTFRKRYRRFERLEQKPTADEFCLMCVKKTKNNTHCSISRLFGDQKTLWTMSGGQTPGAGSRSNGRRKSRYCQRMIFKAATEKLLGLGLKYLVIHCVGRAISKRYVFRNFYRRFRIVLLKDLVAVAHNGCRPKGVRRL